MAKAKNLQKELSELLSRARDAPGLSELFHAYDEYESFASQVRAFFDETQRPRGILSTVDHS